MLHTVATSLPLPFKVIYPQNALISDSVMFFAIMDNFTCHLSRKLNCSRVYSHNNVYIYTKVLVSSKSLEAKTECRANKIFSSFAFRP